jgi:hypothetical protein
MTKSPSLVFSGCRFCERLEMKIATRLAPAIILGVLAATGNADAAVSGTIVRYCECLTNRGTYWIEWEVPANGCSSYDGQTRRSRWVEINGIPVSELIKLTKCEVVTKILPPASTQQSQAVSSTPSAE